MKYRYDWKDLPDYASYSHVPGGEPGLPLPVYALHQIKPDVLVGMAEIFFPRFILYEGGVFLAETFHMEHYTAWKKEYRGDIHQIETRMNQIYLVDKYYGIFTQLNTQNRYYLGEILTQTWRAALEYQFPDRRFEFGGQPEDNNGVSDFRIWFSQRES